MTASVTVFTGLQPRAAATQTTGDLVQLAASLLATLCCLRAARRGGPYARGWALIGVGAGCWALAAAAWAWYGVTRDHVYPFPSLADAGFLLYSVPVAAGLLSFPRTRRHRLAGVRAVLDAVVVAASLMFVSGVAVLGPVVEVGGSGLTRVVSLGYPVVDITLASMVLILGSRVPHAARRPWLLLGTGLVVLTVTDSIFVWLTTAGHTGITGTPLVAGWVAAFFLVAFAASAPVDPVEQSARPFTVLQELLPLAPALAAVVAAALSHFSFDDYLLLLDGMVVLVALAAQQTLVAVEKVRLANGLQDLVAERTTRLHVAEERFGALVAHSSQAILTTALDGVVTSCNPAAERLYGYTADELIGQSGDVLVPVDRQAEDRELCERVGHGEVVPMVETERLRKDGSRVPVALSVSPIRERGVITGVSAIGHDITERRRHEAEVAEARTRALTASRAKSDFLATMSHEIRTPMNGIIGLTSLMLDTPLDDVQRRYASGVRGAGEALLAIIDDILDFSKLEAGKVELEQAPFDPRALVEEVGALLAPAATAKRLELVAFCDPDMPAWLLGDAGRLRQVLINLVSNGVKFTAEGEVVLSARVGGMDGDRALLELEVRDTGIGIDPSDQDRLFEPFSQADASTTRRFGGTGLGLAICRRLVAAMDGRLSLDSRRGAGTTFRLSVPLPVLAGTATTEATALPAGLRMLVVDDNGTNRLVLRDQLSSWHVDVDTAENAASAWQLLHEAARAGRRYDAAVLDLCMPGEHGLDLARRITADPTLSGTPMMILTSAGKVTGTDLESAGVRACVEKPVRASTLFDALASLVTPAPSTAPAAQAEPGAAPPDHRGSVLVVEDNEVNQIVAQGMLRKLGYSVDLACDGLQALAALDRAHYDAVLMDCHMPEMDGFAATAELRLREGTARHTPVIAMTAGVLPEERERCLAVGMDDFVPKPVDPDVLRSVLDRWTLGTTEPAPVAPEIDRPVAVLDADRIELLRGMGSGDAPGVLPLVVQTFTEAAEGHLQALFSAHTAGDSAALAAASHKLRGSAANIGAQRVAAACAPIEDLARAGHLVPRAALDTVETELGAALAEMASLVRTHAGSAP